MITNDILCIRYYSEFNLLIKRLWVRDDISIANAMTDVITGGFGIVLKTCRSKLRNQKGHD